MNQVFNWDPENREEKKRYYREKYLRRNFEGRTSNRNNSDKVNLKKEEAKGSNASLYVGCVLAILSILVGVYYVIAYKEGNDFNLAIVQLAGLGGIACLVLSLLKFRNAGAVVLGICDFFAMLWFLRIYYPVVIDSDIMSGSITITPDIANLIVVTAVLLVISIAANVLAWKKNNGGKR